jgi:hypothetical protein
MWLNMTFEQKNGFLVLEYKYECKNIILLVGKYEC